MADPFIGEIRMVGFNFAPLAWALCNGQLLSIAQYDALFALIGTTYGGDGQTTFAVPDLRDRAPVHFGMGLNMGDFGGQAAHVLTTAETEHAHVLKASANQANTGNPRRTSSPRSVEAARTRMRRGRTCRSIRPIPPSAWRS